MKIKTLEVAGIMSAMHSMRNPMNSWHLNDTVSDLGSINIGPNDKKLSQRLANAGPEHAKHLRQIHVWVDVTLPRYIWSELDTYNYSPKVSTSTMHRIHSRPLTQDDFETPMLDCVIEDINKEIAKFNGYSRIDPEGRNIQRRVIKGKLPESFLQMRTVDFTYATLMNVYRQRKNHRLSEWHLFCDWILELPHFQELTGITNK